MSFSIDALVEKVRAIPPSSEDVVDRFIGKCYKVAGRDGQVGEEDLKAIVNNWPRGCQAGREAFLKSVGVKRKVRFVEFEVLHLFVVPEITGYWEPVEKNDPGIITLESLLVSGSMKLTKIDAITSKGTQTISEVRNVAFDSDALMKVFTVNKKSAIHTREGIVYVTQGLTVKNKKGHNIILRFPILGGTGEVEI